MLLLFSYFVCACVLHSRAYSKGKDTIVKTIDIGAHLSLLVILARIYTKVQGVVANSRHSLQYLQCFATLSLLLEQCNFVAQLLGRL